MSKEMFGSGNKSKSKEDDASQSQTSENDRECISASLFMCKLEELQIVVTTTMDARKNKGR